MQCVGELGGVFAAGLGQVGPTPAAAASIALHLSQRGFMVRLVTADGEDRNTLWHDRASSQNTAPLLEALAVVSAANPNPEALSRPIVKIICDAQGNTISPPLQVDLAVPEAGGQYARTIIKTADPDRYGITPGDYLI